VENTGIRSKSEDDLDIKVIGNVIGSFTSLCDGVEKVPVQKCMFMLWIF
jgi:hypothetical protein